MNVMVIPEDSLKDQYILKPLIAAILKAVGKPRARVTVCADPRLRGVAEALDWDHVQAILTRYPLTDLFLLCVDRDGDPNRRAALDNLERQARGTLRATKLLIAEHAWQEIEVWALAGHDMPRRWTWKAIRQEPNPKETYFEPYAALRGVGREPGDGRKPLAEEAARRYDRVRQRCPEYVRALEDRIRTWLGGGA